MAPFPWCPMLAISASLLSNAFCISSLFPYLGFMVQDMGVADTKDAVGFYSGFIVSAFMFGRFLSAYCWGRFADQHGRLPVIYISLTTIATVSIGFGMSTNLLWAAVCRFLLGAMNGVDGATKTMISEVCGQEHEISGMSFLTGTWSLGLAIGPCIGGSLAEPAKHFPDYFASTGIFGRYPYLLPNLVSAGFALVALCMVYFFLEETCHPGHVQEHESSGNTEKSLWTEMVRPWHMLSEKRIRDVMIILGFFSVGLPNVFPLWALSTVANGGLDWTSEQIGQVLSMVGVLMIVFQICIYPNILKRVGVKKMQRFVSLTPLLLYPTVPMLSNLRDHKGGLVVAAMILYFVLNSCAAGMVINLSLVINHLVNPGRRGEVNGLALMISALSKTLGPMYLSIAFAWSIRHDRPFPFGRHLVFVTMSVCVGVVAVYGWNIIRRDADEVKDDGGRAMAAADTSEGGTERTKLVEVLPEYRTTGDNSTEQPKLFDSSSPSHG